MGIRIIEGKSVFCDRCGDSYGASKIDVWGTGSLFDKNKSDEEIMANFEVVKDFEELFKSYEEFESYKWKIMANGKLLCGSCIAKIKMDIAKIINSYQKEEIKKRLEEIKKDFDK